MPEWLLQLIGYAATGAGAYAAIRADLARLGAEVKGAVEHAKGAAASADKAHSRIDQLIARR